MEANKPIGWYLKETDQQITSYMNDVFKDLSITRFHWMVIRNIAEQGRINTWQFFQEVKNFVTVQEYGEIIQSFADRGWVVMGAEDTCSLTAAGEEAYKDLAMLQKERAAHMLRGISDDEYKLTLSVLNRIIENIVHQ
jgi:DNA-binding MarR family transcriptional regulator